MSFIMFNAKKIANAPQVEPALEGLLRMNKLQESPLKMEEEVFTTSEHTVRKFDAVEENSGRQNFRNVWMANKK